MEEIVISIEVARLAKAKGFPQVPLENGHSSYYVWDGLRRVHSWCKFEVFYSEEFRFEDLFAAPTQSLLLRWLREEKNVYIFVEYEWLEETNAWLYYAYTKKVCNGRVVCDAIGKPKMSYEDALEDALKNALENMV